MKAVMAFAQRAGASGSSAPAGGSDPWSGKSLGSMSRGMSVLSALSDYAGARQKASAMDQEARDERMAGRQEFIQASEKVNAIDADFNALVGQQLAAASGMGIDVGSGSVVAARDAAREDADRERRIIRTSAETNAALRRLRAINLNTSAKAARLGATIKLGFDVATAFMPVPKGG
jgi:hypothetical protein